MHSSIEADLIIVGGGIIGNAIAYEVSNYFHKQKNFKIVVIEKNKRLAAVTTAVNSGIIHAGFDCIPGTLSANLNILGKQLWREKWLKALNANYLNSPSLVLAYNNEELKILDTLYEQGIKNKISSSNIKVINKQELNIIEPLVSPNAQGALYCNESIIIDPVEISNKLAEHAKKHSVEFFLDCEVVNIEKKDQEFEIITKNDLKFKSKYIINASGHSADLLTLAQNFKLKARRGQYCVLSQKKEPIKNILFKIPTIYGKGVLVATTMEGKILVGPTAEEGIKKEHIQNITVGNYFKIEELGKSIIPSLDFSTTEKMVAASRSIDIATNEFIIAYSLMSKSWIDVAGIKSPGISAAPAIAEKVLGMLISSWINK